MACSEQGLPEGEPLHRRPSDPGAAGEGGKRPTPAPPSSAPLEAGGTTNLRSTGSQPAAQAHRDPDTRHRTETPPSAWPPPASAHFPQPLCPGPHGPVQQEARGTRKGKGALEKT